MKKIILILMLSVLGMSTFIYPAAAESADYDHNELSQYEGYSKAMYETIVEETTYLSGRYSENIEYVEKSIDTVKDFANRWYEDTTNTLKPCTDYSVDAVLSCYGAIGTVGSSTFLTVGDWFKNLFTDYEQEYHPIDVDYDFYDGYMTLKAGTSNTYMVNPGYRLFIGGSSGYSFTSDKGYQIYGPGGSFSGMDGDNPDDYSAGVAFYVDGMSVTEYKNFYGIEAKFFFDWRTNGNFSKNVAALNKLGKTVHFETIEGEPIEPKPIDRDESFDRFKRYIDDSSGSKPVVLPKLKPSLTCPGGERINLTVDGSVFLNSDGTVLHVNKDGTAAVNGTTCFLQWEKPVIKYVDDKAVIETPTGKWQDIETGEVTDGDVDDEEVPGEGCDSVLCFLSGIGKGIADVVKTIGDLVKKLLDGLLALFVPDNLDFVSEKFKAVQKIFEEKFKPLKTLKDSFTSIFKDDGTNVLDDFTLDLPILTHPVKLMDMSLVAVGVPLAKKFVSGILIMFTIMYVYRKITGSGGVMEK